MVSLEMVNGRKAVVAASLGTAMREAREKLRFTLAELAVPAAAEFSILHISAMEKEKSCPSLKAPSLLSRRLGVPPTFLREGSLSGAAEPCAVQTDQVCHVYRLYGQIQIGLKQYQEAALFVHTSKEVLIHPDLLLENFRTVRSTTVISAGRRNTFFTPVYEAADTLGLSEDPTTTVDQYSLGIVDYEWLIGRILCLIFFIFFMSGQVCLILSEIFERAIQYSSKEKCKFIYMIGAPLRLGDRSDALALVHLGGLSVNYHILRVSAGSRALLAMLIFQCGHEMRCGRFLTGPSG